jgi:hypothetical protein
MIEPTAEITGVVGKCAVSDVRVKQLRASPRGRIAPEGGALLAARSGDGLLVHVDETGLELEEWRDGA